MQVSKIIFSSFLLSSFLFGFDILNIKSNSNSKSFSKEIENLKKGSFKSLTDVKKVTSVKDILDISNTELINANLINIPGLFGLGIKCDLDKNVAILDPCSFMEPQETKFNLNLGVCAVNVGLSNKCIYDFYQKMCKRWKKKNVETPLKKARASTQNLKTKGDIILKKNLWKGECDLFNSEKREKSIKNPNKVSLDVIEKKYYNPQMIYKYAIYNTGAKSIFDSSLKEWKDCMFVNATGKGNKDLEKCKIINKKMPKTEADISKNIIDGTLSVDDTTIDTLNNDFKNILIIKANYAKKCGNSNNPTKCEDTLWENGFERADGVKIKPKKMYNMQLEDIERKNALLEEYIKYATMPDKDIVFMSEDFIDTLPPKLRKKYRKQAQKKMYQKIVYKSFWRTLTKLEEEATSIKFDAMKVQTSQFYPQVAINEINAMVSKFSVTKRIDTPLKKSGKKR